MSNKALYGNENVLGKIKNTGVGRYLRGTNSYIIKKYMKVILYNPKLILNFLYSLIYNILIYGIGFYRLLVIADAGSRISKRFSAKLRIDKRLYLGGKYISDISGLPAYIKLARDSLMHVKGRVKLGPGVRIITDPGARVTIGDNTYITASSNIYCSKNINIGSDCAIAWGTTIIDTDFHKICYNNEKAYQISKAVSIGDKVWIGCNSTILKGVSIGNNSVIAANSVVNRDVPPNCLVAGNPAKIVKRDINWAV